MDKIIEFIEKIFDIQKGTMKLIIVAFVSTLCLLIFSDHTLKKLSLLDFKNGYKNFIGPIFSISALLLIFSLLSFIWTKGSDYFSKRKANSIIRKKVDFLTIPEKIILREFYIQGKTTIQLSPQDESVISLENKWIIAKASNSGTVSYKGILWPYSIDEYALELISPLKLGLSNNPTDNEQAKIYRERPDYLKS